jgi:hypothetical protein
MRRQLGLDKQSATFLAEVVNGQLILTVADVVPRAEREWLDGDHVSELITSAERSIAEGHLRQPARSDRARTRGLRNNATTVSGENDLVVSAPDPSFLLDARRPKDRTPLRQERSSNECRARRT